MFVPGKISARQLITYSLFFLCAYAAWARGGTYPSLQWPLLIGALLLCFSPFLLERNRRRPFVLRIYKDPIFGIGLGLIVLLLLQWINSSHLVVYNDSGGAELAKDPLKWLPWSVERSEAGEMLIWFFPAWICMIFIRNLLHRKHVVALLYLLAVNSAVLACIGLIQVTVGTRMVLGIWEQPHTVFFASFGYSNHACAWFYLNAFLAGGLAHLALVRKKPVVQLISWSLVFVLCVVSVFMTLSRFGAVIALVLLGAFLVVFLKHTSIQHKGNSMLNIYIFSGIIALFGIALFFGAGGGTLAREIGEKSLTGEISVAGDFRGRLTQMKPAWMIARDYPLFGAGGWSYRWMIRLYVPPEEWELWSRAGMANVHCDPLQFLAEFGIVGAGCMGVAVVLLIREVYAAHHNVLFYWVTGGLMIVFIHSLIDLPFRSPAILLTWCCLAAALSRLTGKRKSSS